MNLRGRRRPLSGCSQRTSASIPRIFPLDSDATRLVLEPKLAVVDRRPEIVLELESLPDLVAQPSVEDRDPARPRVFACSIAMSASCRRLAASAGPSSKSDDPDTRRDRESPTGRQPHRLGQTCAQLLGPLKRGVGVATPRARERRTRHRGAGTERERSGIAWRSLSAIGEEHLVPDRVTERVVDELEAVEVEAEQRHATGRCGAGGRGRAVRPR